jgi:hypothetical protein
MAVRGGRGEWVGMNRGGENGVQDRKENVKHYNMSHHDRE